ncbi:hypothetical protein HID58_092881 [Brassica napus]|uniref:Uncharacterized protein n=1 Tax=Brassica napus TaxID=3708 RepID=A0ABQ7XCU6_BRANA|nr:hypothetical protein HID58_092881 [Brassica napus]
MGAHRLIYLLNGDRKDVALNQTNLGLTTAISLFVHQSLIPEFLTCLSSVVPSVREKELRRCSPFLERSSIPGDDAATDLRSNEWKAVPDIWRSSADKYGDKVVVLDPFRMVSFHLFLKCWNVSTMAHFVLSITLQNTMCS